MDTDAVPADSSLALMVEGSWPNSTRPEISTTDHLTVSSTQAAYLVSNFVKKSPQAMARDRFLGSNFVFKKNFHGQNVQFFRPNHLKLYELAFLAHIAHDMHPSYSLLNTQCYFYAALIYATAENYGQVLADESADKSQDDLVYIHGLHLSDKYGRWNGVKVTDISPDSHDVQALIQCFRVDIVVEIDNVRLFNEH